MALLRMQRHLAACGVMLVAFAVAASALGAVAAVGSTPAVAASGLLPEHLRGRAEVMRQLVQGSRFCRWYPQHRLCIMVAKNLGFCDRHPNHPHCKDGDDRFCRRHPFHRHCDKPPSPS